MGLFDKIKEPIFLKESSFAEEHLVALQSLLENYQNASKEILNQLEQEIKFVQAGIASEQRIAFELKNSHMPMYVLHDLYLKHKDLTAQIDYLIVTRRCTFVIECKNLFGNIEVRNNGDFIRSTPHRGKYIHKEGIYSPITQNARHLALIKEIRREAKTNLLSRALFERNFDSIYHSVVVLANPKTVLNAKFATKDVKQKIIRGDQLIAHIQKINQECGLTDSSEKDMTALAHFFQSAHQEQEDHYLVKFQKILDEAPASPEQQSTDSIPEVEPPPLPDEKLLCPKCGAPMIKRVAKQGARAGSAFYGCSQYPKCKGIINIDFAHKKGKP